jgi:copper chaperone
LDGPEQRGEIMIAKTYKVPDVSCSHCKRAIESALGAIEGVQKVEVDVEKKTVDLKFDETTVTEAAVLDALSQEGYPAAA